MPIESNDNVLVLRVLEHELANRYNSSFRRGEKTWEHSKEQCRGGYNYGRTVWQAYRSTRGDMAVVASTVNVLLDIADWPAAGSIAWNVRRFIRRATPDQIMEYEQLLLEVIRKDKGKLRSGPAFIDMDDVFWGSDRCQDEIERFKRVHF